MRTLKILILPLFLVAALCLSGCQSGQMGTILGPSIGGGLALIDAGYQYYDKGKVNWQRSVTIGNAGWNIGQTAGYATDNYQMKEEIRKIKKSQRGK